MPLNLINKYNTLLLFLYLFLYLFLSITFYLYTLFCSPTHPTQFFSLSPTFSVSLFFNFSFFLCIFVFHPLYAAISLSFSRCISSLCPTHTIHLSLSILLSFFVFHPPFASLSLSLSLSLYITLMPRPQIYKCGTKKSTEICKISLQTEWFCLTNFAVFFSNLGYDSSKSSISKWIKSFNINKLIAYQGKLHLSPLQCTPFGTLLTNPSITCTFQVCKVLFEDPHQLPLFNIVYGLRSLFQMWF